jgi:tRNA pseudouridine55 synthase
MPLRRSTVHSLELLAYDGRVAALDLLVSSGTYVRSIAEALGGHCRTLRRTEVGPFRVDDADRERILPPADALPFLAMVDVGEEGARALNTGRATPWPNGPWQVPGTQHVRAVHGGTLVAVARADGGVLRPETVLAE